MDQLLVVQLQNGRLHLRQVVRQQIGVAPCGLAGAASRHGRVQTQSDLIYESMVYLTHVSLSMCVHIYIYIYIYVQYMYMIYIYIYAIHVYDIYIYIFISVSNV